MYEGWISPPDISAKILSRFTVVDGEFAYDCKFYDMRMVAWIGLYFYWVFSKRKQKERKSEMPSRRDER